MAKAGSAASTGGGTPEPSKPTGPAWFEFGRALLLRAADRMPAEATSDVPPADAPGDLEARVIGAAGALLDSLDGIEPFAVLAANARLDVAEAQMLALAAAAEADANCRNLLAVVQGDPNRSRLTIGELSGLLGPGHPGALTVANDTALRRSGFIDVIQNGPWVDHVIALHPGVVWALLGDTSPDPELPADITVHDVEAEHARPDQRNDLVVVVGTDRMRRRQVGTSHAIGDRFLLASAPSTEAEWGALVREATITGRGLLIEVDDSIDTVTRKWLRRATHLVMVLSAKSAPPVDQLPERSWLEVTAAATDPTDEEWAAAFGPDVDRTHRLTFDQMHRVQRSRKAVGGDIDAAVRRLASGPLEQLTRRIAPERTWDDIVLSPERKQLLRSVVDRYQHSNQVFDTWGFSPNPSRGLVALFSGPSGTGKTLASEIIAGELGLDVFKLDLSSVVSKYIGETEKNLEQIFDAASAGNMVLFFDEADSLFGKRSEVKDARDRYANIEVSYLLQRLEAYDGLVVLATNFEKNVDEAFLRRIHVRVEFSMPGADERRAIWLVNLPAAAPMVDLDLDWLAEQFELSGASIRNAAIHAAFAAAAAGSEITMEHAVRGVAHELRKMGRLLKDKDFGKYHALVTV